MEYIHRVVSHPTADVSQAEFNGRYPPMRRRALPLAGGSRVTDSSRWPGASTDLGASSAPPTHFPSHGFAGFQIVSGNATGAGERTIPGHGPTHTTRSTL